MIVIPITYYIRKNKINHKMNKKKLVVVLPGGGTRGIIQAKIMQKLDEVVQAKLPVDYEYKGLNHYVSYVAGTSIGALNAMSVATKYSCNDIIDLFLNSAGNVLNKNGWLPLNVPYFSNESMKNILNTQFENQTFKDIQTKVLINSYNLQNTQQTIFSNIGTEEIRQQYKEFVQNIDSIKVKDAVLASASLPGLLPAHQLEYQKFGENGIEKYYEIDGGMINNSPILELLATIQAFDHIKLSDLFVISIGTGTCKGDLGYLNNSGVLSYLKDIRSLMTHHIISSQHATESQAKRILESSGGNFHNLNPHLSVNDYCNGINDSKAQIEKYVDITNDFLEQNDELINKLADQIIQNCL